MWEEGGTCLLAVQAWERGERGQELGATWEKGKPASLAVITSALGTDDTVREAF